MEGGSNTLMISLLGGGTLVLLGLTFYLFYRRANPRGRKATGKGNLVNRVVNIAGRFARQNKFRFIAPALMQAKDATADIDALVIGYFGVLGVKGLGYNGDIYGSAAEEQWLQVGDDKKRAHFPNPIDEAAADVRVIRDALFKAKLKQVPVQVVTVFADPATKLLIPKGTGHYTVKTFKELLKSDKFEEDKGIDLDAVEAAIRPALVEEA